MTQYQQPYQSPSPYPVGYVPYAPQPIDLLAPARRSAVMLWILGTLMLLLSACSVGMGSMWSSLKGQPEFAEAIHKLEEQSGPVSVKTNLIVSGVLIGGAALSYIVMAFFVRRGGIAAATIAIIVVGLVTACMLLNFGYALLQANVGAVCLGVPIIATHALLLVWLVQTARASSKIGLMQAQYQAQYWQYQQVQQAYGYGGYPPQQIPQQPPAQQQPQPPYPQQPSPPAGDSANDGSSTQG